MAKRVTGKRTTVEKSARPRLKTAAPRARKPAGRPTRRTAGAEVDVAPLVAESPPPEPASSGVRISLEDLTVEADEAEVERSQLKALVSVRRGELVVHAERVNLDWPGGRDKFLRKATRALGAAGIATRITEACLAELRGLLRARSNEPARS